MDMVAVGSCLRSCSRTKTSLRSTSRKACRRSPSGSRTRRADESLYEMALRPAEREALHHPPDRQGHQRRDHLRATPTPTAIWAGSSSTGTRRRCIWLWSTAWSPPSRASSTSRSSQFGSGRVGVNPQHGRAAVTEYLVLHRFAAHTLLEAYPKTGRRHQIRVHLYSIGHAIVGDRRYGDLPLQRQYPRMMLHAQKLTIRLRNNELLTLEAPPPESFERMLQMADTP